MSDKCTYATVGINDQREEPVIVTGKRNATFEIGSEEFERTAILRLPERMTESEFNQWKSEAGVDLIDIYFHCVHQKPRHPEPPEPAADDGDDSDDPDRPEEEAERVASEEGQQPLVTDGGEELPDLSGLEEGQEVRIYYRSSRSGNEVDREGAVSEIIEPDDGLLVRVHTGNPEPLKHVYVAMMYAESKDGEERVHAFSQTTEPEGMDWEDGPDLGRVYTLHYEITRNTYLGPVDRVVRTDRKTPVMMTDGGSSMPRLALEHLKELKAADAKIGEWLSEVTGDGFEAFSEIYASEHSRPEANNDIQLGEGFSLKEAEYAELIGILEQSRAAAEEEPTVLGVRNRLLIQLILANPEEYARVKAEAAERRKEAQEEARKQFSEAMSRQRMNERMTDLGTDGVDIPIGEDDDG
jgi:hypothetical protein